MGKKKFIDKRRSATFHLLSRDTSALSFTDDTGSQPSDRVFVRVDNNPYSVAGLSPDDEPEVHDSDSIFADAPGDTDEEASCPPSWSRGDAPKTPGSLPDYIKKEILELGLPDDGYNYLLHLRDIKNTGGGSAYYHNSKARFDNVPIDVKAYDASRVRVTSEAGGEGNEESMYAVASKVVGVRVQKAVDPDLVRLLDDSDLSRFGSDVEDLEEDFVFKANQPDGEEDIEEEEVEEDVLFLKGDKTVDLKEESTLEGENGYVQGNEDFEPGGYEKPRVHRLLDEQFDLLTFREYGDSDNDDAPDLDNEGEPLADKLKYALKDHKIDDLELEDNRSTVNQLDISDDVIRKCKEYAETYCVDNQNDEEVVMVQESSDESEAWDCATIVSTYSNLDNHPGKITAPENPKRKTLISLRGKEKLPVEFLPHKRKSVENLTTKVNSGDDKPKWKPRSEESKDEKKERKAAVKGERKEARQAKKELKVLYKCEAQRAQKGAAIAGPSSIHLM